VSRYQKGKTNLDFTEARDSEWQWHQLGHTQVCTSLQTDTHASTPPLSSFTGRMPFLTPNQQRHSTEGKGCDIYTAIKIRVTSVGNAHVIATRLRKVKGKNAMVQRVTEKRQPETWTKENWATAKLGNENGPVGKKVNGSCVIFPLSLFFSCPFTVAVLL